MGRTEACRWAADRLTKSIGHARSWFQAKGSGRGVQLSPISTTPSARESSLARGPVEAIDCRNGKLLVQNGAAAYWFTSTNEPAAALRSAPS